MIRLAHVSDAGPIARIYEPSVSGAVTSFELVPPSEEEMARRIDSGLSFAPWLVGTAGVEVVGFAYASKHRDRAAYQWSVDVSVYVHEGRRHQGIGRALYTSLFALLRRQGFYAAHAGITLPNPASVGLHESLGFEPVGVYPRVGYKMGAWHDVGWWQLTLSERVADPAPPLALAEAQRDPGWTAALEAGLPLLRP